MKMVLTLLSLVTFIQLNAAPRDARECVVRNGLPNFYFKCNNKKTVKVAYFGGSITAQPGWRVQSLDLFRKQFPQTVFEEIYAPIGGTDSLLGAFRLKRDVTAHKPDLVFVEFAAKDKESMWYPADSNRFFRHFRRYAAGIPSTDERFPLCVYYIIR